MEKKLIKNGDIILDGTLNRFQKERQAFYKLELYEKNEEELGCELDTLMIAAKEGFTYYEAGEWRTVINDGEDNSLEWGIIYYDGEWCISSPEICCNAKDYGKKRRLLD